MKAALKCAQIHYWTMSLTMNRVEWRDDQLHNSLLFEALHFFSTLFYLALPLITSSPLPSFFLLSSPLPSNPSSHQPLYLTYHLSVLLKNRATRPWCSHPVAAVNQVWNEPKVSPSLTPLHSQSPPPSLLDRDPKSCRPPAGVHSPESLIPEEWVRPKRSARYCINLNQ